ncbi:MAG: hypothetical protein K8F52_04415 [Candidatus Scalindua rubra]|uniref:Uncharacterized protein n=1 Tax=Candidatus Scalindua brodae TaxID=237368 RepID=A0A0B0EGE0_9BACT|nr:MAG: hypothetical protein SCABRO_02102 [Candidatus Scalindua brodae]MBZ0107889.1 hypothetical protein [Candidatus Scalindua rubra]
MKIEINNLQLIDDIVEKADLRLKYNKPSAVNRLKGCLKHMISKRIQWKMASEEPLKFELMVKPFEENNRRLWFLSINFLQLRHQSLNLLSSIL